MACKLQRRRAGEEIRRGAGASLSAGFGGGGGGYEGPDLISRLPDDLLHHVLVFVSLLEAIRTCVLSRRWVAVWAGLPQLRFDHDDGCTVEHFPDLVDSCLRRYAEDLDLRDLTISVHLHPDVDAGRVASWAAFAARRVTGRFDLSVTSAEFVHEPALEIPCFVRATEISLYVSGIPVRLPHDAAATGGGEFTRLTKLQMCEFRVSDDGDGISELVSRRCPCLEVVELERIDGVEALTLITDSLQSLRLVSIFPLQRLKAKARNLRKMQVYDCFASSSWRRTEMWLAAPALELLVWEDRCPDEVRLISFPAYLKKLVVDELSAKILVAFFGRRTFFTEILQLFSRADVLRLAFPIAPDSEEQKRLLHNTKLPCCSELELAVTKNGHMYGSTILHFLKNSSSIRKLTLQLLHYNQKYSRYLDPKYSAQCSSICTCRQPSKWWRDEDFSLDSLEQVVVDGFMSTCDEKNLIYFIVRNSKALKMVSVVFAMDAYPSRRFRRNLRKLSTASSGCTIHLKIPCRWKYYTGRYPYTTECNRIKIIIVKG